MRLSPYYTNAALDKCISGKWREQRRHEKRQTPATEKKRERRAMELREVGLDDEGGRKDLLRLQGRAA